MSARAKRIAASAAAMAVGAAAPLAMAQPAGALYPSGCPNYAVGDWSTNCWVGTGYQTASDEVTGVQTVINLYPVTYGAGVARDGHFTSSTKAGVVTWQRDYTQLRGTIGIDGTVGSDTWQAMHGEVADGSYTVANGYKYFSNSDHAVPGYQVGNWFRLSTDGSQQWWVMTQSGVYTRVQTFGPTA